MGLIQAKMIQNKISELNILNDKLNVEKNIKNLESLENIECYKIKIDVKKIVQRFIEPHCYKSDLTKKKNI